MIWIIYHTDSDGYAAAWAVYRYLRKTHTETPPISYWSMGYGSKLPDIDYEEDLVYMVDFALQPAEKMDEFAKKLKGRLWWYDHHDTSMQMQKEYPALHYAPGTRLVEFEGRPISGCELTWKCLMTDAPMPPVLRIVGDWDTWRWKKMSVSAQHEAKAFQHYFRAYDFDPRTHEGRQRWASMGDPTALNKALEVGRTLISYQENEWRKTVGWLSFEAKFAGYRAIIVNRSGGSEMFKGYYDPEKHDIMVTFSYVKGKYITSSMYTDKPEIHLGELATRLGAEGDIGTGGGHPGAAGFQCGWDYFQSLIEK